MENLPEIFFKSIFTQKLLTLFSAVPAEVRSISVFRWPTLGLSFAGCNICSASQNMIRAPIRSAGAWPKTKKTKKGFYSLFWTDLCPDQPVCRVFVVQHLHDLTLLQRQRFFRRFPRHRHIVLDGHKHRKRSFRNTAAVAALRITLMVSPDRIRRHTSSIRRGRSSIQSPKQIVISVLLGVRNFIAW